MKSSSRSNNNIKLTNDSFFFDLFDVDSIEDHSNIEELQRVYDSPAVNAKLKSNETYYGLHQASIFGQREEIRSENVAQIMNDDTQEDLTSLI